MKLKDYPTLNREWDKGKIKAETKGLLKEIGELQYKMYAQQKYSLLIVFQGIDASGKDGLTRGLLRYCNPVGIKVKSFKKPTPEEAAHDFLWRVHSETPARGEIQVFIRSHYEDILVPSVEGYIPAQTIDQRFYLMNDFEKLLMHNDTKILKFFLHVSPETQKERLMERIEMKRKHWKHKDGDWDTRKKMEDYLKVYERIFEKCSQVPWHIVPSDKNWQKLYAVSVEVLKTLKGLDLEWPDLQTEIFSQEKQA